MNYSLLSSRSALATALLLVLHGSLLMAQTSPGAPAGNPIYTCDFSSDPMHPDDRQTAWWTNSPSQVSWDKDVVHSGKGSLKLTNPDPGKSVVVYSPFVAYTGPTIHVSVELKQDSVAQGTNKPTVAVYYYDQDRKPLSLPWNLFHDQLMLPDGTLDWTPYNQTFTFPSGSPPPAFARVVINLSGSGTFWIDQASLSLAQ